MAAEDEGELADGVTLGLITEDEMRSYDPSPLVRDYEVAARLVGRMSGRPEQVQAAADALCAFFHRLLADRQFWEVATRVQEAEPIRVDGFLADIRQFEAFEHRLLEEAGLRSGAAAEIAQQLSAAITQYRMGDLARVGRIRSGITEIEGLVCDQGFDYGEPERRRAMERRCSRALRVAAAATAIAISFPLSSTALAIGGTIGGLLTIAQEMRDD